MDKDQAKSFAERFASGAYTDAEHEAFFQWLSGLPIAESKSLIEDYSAIFEALPTAPARKELWDKIAPKLDEQAKPTVQRSRIYFLSRIAAAAVIIGILSVIVWPGLQHNTQTEKIADVPAPAANRATITLGNGQQVDLDNAGNGTLAHQANTRVVKLTDGEVAYMADNKAGTEIMYNTLTNPRGSQVVTLTLGDGTKAWLNAESSIRYPVAFTGQSRMVEVTGEVYLEVAQDQHKPFGVKQGKTSIEVLGTAFDVNAYGDESALEVTVLEGKVRVENLVLLPGQQAIVTDSARRSGTVDTSDVMAWKNGRFAFHGASLAMVMRQLARWYNVKVVYEGAIPHQHFSGGIGRSLNLDQVLKILAGTGVNYRIQGGQDKTLTIRPANQ